MGLRCLYWDSAPPGVRHGALRRRMPWRAHCGASGAWARACSGSKGEADGMHLRGPRGFGAGKASGRAGYGVPHGVGGQDGHGAAGVPAANPGAPERDRGNQPAVGTPHMQPALSGRAHHPGHAAQPHLQHCGFARVLCRFPKQFAPERAIVRSAKLSARRAGHGVSLQQSGGRHGGQPPGKALRCEL